MSVKNKQDLQGVRTAAELERKWSFSKTFAEVFGLAKEAQDEAKKAQQAAEEVLDNATQEEIFNLLTNNGALKGLYMKDGVLYINASYLVTGIIKSENGKLVIDLSGETEPTFNTGISTNGLTIRGDEADAQKLVDIGSVWTDYGYYTGLLTFYSTTGEKVLHIGESVNTSTGEQEGAGMSFNTQDGARKVFIYSTDSTDSGLRLYNGDQIVGVFAVAQSGKPYLQLYNGGCEVYNTDGDRRIYAYVGSNGGDLLVTNKDDTRYSRLHDNGSQMGLWLTAGGATQGSFLADANGSNLTTTKIHGKTVSWKDNGDGTYTLIGQ